MGSRVRVPPRSPMKSGRTCIFRYGAQALWDPGTRWGHKIVKSVLGIKSMKIETRPSAVSIEEMDWGQAFQFRHRDKNYIGIKAFISAGADRLPMVAVIWPSHPNRQNEPGVYDAAVLRGKSLIGLSEAALVLSHNLDDTRLDDAVTGAPGGILLSADNELVMPVCGDKTRYLDLIPVNYWISHQVRFWPRSRSGHWSAMS
jgi:hypothetical protein